MFEIKEDQSAEETRTEKIRQIRGLVRGIKSQSNTLKNLLDSFVQLITDIPQAERDQFDLDTEQKAQIVSAVMESQRLLDILTRAKADERIEGGFGL